MEPLLFYDTETTGLPLFKEPSDHPGQPHIVQLAACLVDAKTQKTLSRINEIVRPDGWTIPDEVAAIHGITTERALAEGISEHTALEMFLCLSRQSWERVAHNESFDARIIRIAMMRYEGRERADEWKARAAECTARMATPICALPPTGKMLSAGVNKFKTPTLAEAYRHFFGRDFENAHSAMADVEACIAIYFAMKGDVW